MLITEEKILSYFPKHLSWATEIDLATAWATSHEGLRALQRQRPPPDIRAIVGLWGNLTDPVALRTLARIGQLRGPNTGQRFHPKVFIFRGDSKSVAWIGSANFTAGGFEMNNEAVFETSDTVSVQNWFDDLWEHTAPIDAAAIDAYAESRKNNPPSPELRPTPNTRDLDPPGLLREVTNWQSYVKALEQCDGWWWSNHHSWSVLGEHSSWRETAEILHDVVAQPDWDELEQYDRLRLLGLTRDGHWGLFGRMRWAALKTVFGANQQAIQRIVLGVVAAEDSAFPQLAFDAYRELQDIVGIGPGIATRLLTFARPERFVSVNEASKDGLASSFGLAPTTLGNPDNYERLLTAIYDQDWYRNPAPRNARERAISRIRAALLDSFVYVTKNVD